MKSLNELEQFYSKELLDELQVLEQQRRQTLKKLMSWIVPVWCVAIVLGLFLIGRESAPLFVLFTAIGISVLVYQWIIRGYVTNFKSVVIKRIINFIDPNLQYAPEQYFSRTSYMKSRIFTQRPDVYKGDDFVKGIIEKTAIEFSELHTQYITRDSKGRTQHHTIFKGLFFQGDFNKHFNGSTFVLPDSAESLFGGVGKFLQSINVGRPELVRLEDPEFEKMFVVYSTDQIEARYVLSTSLMRRIVDFKQKSGRKVYLSFIDSNVYIAVKYNRNLFEPKIFQTLLDFNPIKEYYEDLCLAIGVVDDLNLNTRIWTKQ